MIMFRVALNLKTERLLDFMLEMEDWMIEAGEIMSMLAMAGPVHRRRMNERDQV